MCSLLRECLLSLRRGVGGWQPAGRVRRPMHINTHVYAYTYTGAHVCLYKYVHVFRNHGFATIPPILTMLLEFLLVSPKLHTYVLSSPVRSLARSAIPRVLSCPLLFRLYWFQSHSCLPLPKMPTKKKGVQICLQFSLQTQDRMCIINFAFTNPLDWFFFSLPFSLVMVVT